MSDVWSRWCDKVAAFVCYEREMYGSDRTEKVGREGKRKGKRDEVREEAGETERGKTSSSSGHVLSLLY